MNRMEQGVLIGGLALALGLPTGIYLFGVRPIEADLGTKRQELAQVIQERDSSASLLTKQQVVWENLSEEIGRLHLFDLRTEQNFDATIVNRSNIGLIALSEIFEKNGVSIDSLEPMPSENSTIAVNGVAQGGIARRKYLIKANGRYKSLLAAFGAMKQLPPTLEVNRYDLAYLTADGQQAKMALELAISFNYLLTPDQLSRVASDSVPAPAAAPAAPPTGLVMPASGSVSHSLVDRMLAWVMPPAAAAPAKAAPPTKKPAYTIPVSKDLTLGRSEPFLPLTPAGTGPIAVKAPLALPATPPLRLALLGVLIGGDGPPNALIQLDGQRLRVRPGAMLVNGAEVLAIGGNYILVRHSGTIHRISLSRGAEDEAPAAFAAPPPAAPPSLPAAPVMPIVPGIPAIPGMPAVSGN